MNAAAAAGTADGGALRRGSSASREGFICSPPPIPDPTSADLGPDLRRVKLLFGYTAAAENSGAQRPTSDSSFPLCLAVMVKPTDPEFPHEELLPKGLRLCLTYRYHVVLNTPSTASEEQTTKPGIRSFRRSSTVHTNYALETEVHVHDPHMPDKLRRAFEVVACNALHAHCGSMYHTLKAVERNIAPTFNLFKTRDPEGFAAYCQRLQPPTWTESEQLRLEEAIVCYAQVEDPKQKWTNIAKFVRGSRTARDCARRYQECRKAVLEAKQTTLHDEPSQAPQLSLVPNELPSPPGQSAAAAAPRSPEHAEDVKLEGLELRNITLLYLSLARLVVACGRCRRPIETSVKPPRLLQPAREADTALYFQTGDVPRSVTARHACPKCSNTVSIHLTAGPCVRLSQNLPPILVMGVHWKTCSRPNFLWSARSAARRWNAAMCIQGPYER